MSKQEIKKDPLLDGDEETKESVKSAKPKVEAKPATPAVKVAEPAKTTAKAMAVNKDVVAETKEILEKAPHVNFIIPMAEGEPENAADTIQINGYRLTIKKGVMVNIPLPVAKLLAEKYKIQMEAGKDKRIDRSSEVSDALS